ncbi:cytochrome c oxidase subunit 10, putative [Leishmania panamensis]|uniref:Cytochrome c oxidase subunit 10 n=7 Tax=Viannia TaxID=37616 RepID=A4HCQ2_LEIBR|nr:putative cytochrome c oxidase subunit 10 [Leishmania braziliensis MHOM/BR/75/M2904]XP_010699200.1 cytochrome c oxidase subunit 10, putative [Leishmania panamensis]KAI5688466.1 hypothetical protein MNV84_03935 [Leishmania braziliensis]CCM15742.1 cytochrome c oxidase subunit 10, putative [Leishmania guyanensis]AIN98493.1 cytochrome c oxidase subunit 10, putative [Leishmania panamensis]CAJ2473138.1 unnamed protein product [Leishmania braziliensis]CAJ2473636.1 unnamed protein product [Leishman
MMRRFTSRISAFTAMPAVEQIRQFHFPLTSPPIDIEYLDSDPLEFAVRTEARNWGFDDLQYMRELAFVRINNNPSIGDFRTMTPEERRDLFWGSDRQDFFRHITYKLTGNPEHLYHRGW